MSKYIDRKVRHGIIYKWCGRCLTYHPESEFNLCAATHDHLQGYCRVCNVLYCKDWRKERHQTEAR